MSDHTHLHPELQTWAATNLCEDMRRVVHLTKVESNSDTQDEPYKSLYTARELLSGIKARLDSCPKHLQEMEDYHVLCASAKIQLGLNYLFTEEPSLGEKAFEECLQLLVDAPSKVKTASLSMQAHNHLGVMWGNRGDQQKALEYLLKSKAVYESHIALPPPLTETEWLAGETTSEWEREKAFENLHTHTLFYLAQVYSNLGQDKVSAQYCQTTLSRLLETHEYDANEWSLDCATLSQYYLKVEAYSQARHCLASASCVFAKFCSNSGDLSDEMREKTERGKADLSRCWTKYCISLLRSSRDHQEGNRHEHPKTKPFRFDPLEVADIEAEVTADLTENYDRAKAVFLFAQKHIDIGKNTFTLEEYASEYVHISQDHSLLFKLLAYFEADPALKCRMYKRRIDMLSALLQELNPQHYLALCRQLTYELGEIHSEMADLKIVISSDAPSPHAIGKINKLVRSGIEHYENFLQTFTDSSGEFPDPIDEDCLRPILCAKMFMARLHSKLINPDTTQQVLLSGYDDCM